MYKKILIPTDGSETSRLALEEALLLADDQAAEAYVVHVHDPCDDVARQSLEELPTFLLEEHALDHAIERARTHGVRVTTAAVNAAGRQTADVITAEAVVSGADLIAMGTHGRRGIQRTLLGSVAEGVARSATVPVLLIRGRSKSVL